MDDRDSSTAERPWFHVFNRGAARRFVFERDDHRRLFLAILSAEVEAKRLDVHAYCLLGNHYHLLVQASTADLSLAMREIGRGYTKAFNRDRERDGPIFRGPYRAKPLTDERYRRNTLCYIDQNPVAARLSERSYDYAFCSAHHFHHGTTPKWLASNWVESVVRDWTGTSGLPVGLYGRNPRHTLAEDAFELVESRSNSKAASDPLRGMSDRPAIRKWLESTSALDEDGPQVLPLASTSAVRRVVAKAHLKGQGRAGALGRPQITGRETMEDGLLRVLCRLRYQDVARVLGTTRQGAQRRCRMYDGSFAADGGYRKCAIDVAWDAVCSSRGHL